MIARTSIPSKRDKSFTHFHRPRKNPKKVTFYDYVTQCIISKLTALNKVVRLMPSIR